MPNTRQSYKGGYNMGLLEATHNLLEEMAKGKTQQELAAQLHVSQPIISNILNNKGIHFKTAAELIDNLTHEIFVKLIKMVRPDAPIEIIDIHKLKTIDVYRISGLKNFEAIKSREPIFSLRIPPEFFPSDYGVLVPGHSMENEYPEGCAVGIQDIKQEEFFAGEDYLCCLPFEGLVIRRVMVSPERGSLEFRPINPNKENFNSQTFVFEEAISKIKGRVTWVSKRTIK